MRMTGRWRSDCSARGPDPGRSPPVAPRFRLSFRPHRHPLSRASRMATGIVTSQFTGVDFLSFDSLLSEEERAIRDTVRSWVDENLMPVIGQAYIEGKFPRQLIPGMAALGLFGANLPETYGCAGLNNVAYGLIMQELERGDSGIRSFASVQGALV